MEALVVIVFGGGILLVASIIVAVCIWPNAERRADELLRVVLTPEEYRQLVQQGHVDIPSPSDPARVYQVPRYAGRVQVRVDGIVRECLCLQPLVWVPDPDLVAIHKLMIQANEEVYLQTANRRNVYLY